MSQQEDSESDIWEYKPLEKKKKRHKSPPATPNVTKRRCTLRKTPKRKVQAADSGGCGADVDIGGHEPPADTVKTDHAAEGHASSGHFCPMCQMPFNILVVQTQRWHVAECLDTCRDTCTGTQTSMLNILYFIIYILKKLDTI